MEGVVITQNYCGPIREVTKERWSGAAPLRFIKPQNLMFNHSTTLGFLSGDLPADSLALSLIKIMSEVGRGN